MKQDEGNSSYNAKHNHEFMKEAHNYKNFVESFLLEFISPDNKVLDFGASDGDYATRLTKKGVKVTCVEIDDFFRSEIESKGLEVYKYLSEVSSGQNKIYSLDVIEHIEDDLTIMKDLYSKLSGGGEILIYVPAFNCLYGPLDELAGHYRRYTKSAMVKLMKQAGFKIESARYVDCIGFFASLYFKYFGSKDGVFRSGNILFYYKYIFPVSRFFDKIFYPFMGKNLLVRGRKK